MTHPTVWRALSSLQRLYLSMYIVWYLSRYIGRFCALGSHPGTYSTRTVYCTCKHRAFVHPSADHDVSRWTVDQTLVGQSMAGVDSAVDGPSVSSSTLRTRPRVPGLALARRGAQIRASISPRAKNVYKDVFVRPRDDSNSVFAFDFLYIIFSLLVIANRILYL
jgi:hypothetical protein